MLFEFFVPFTGYKTTVQKTTNSAPYGWCHCHLAMRNGLELRGPLFLGGWVDLQKGRSTPRVPGIYIYILYIEKQILSIYDMHMYWYEIDIRYWILQSCCRVEWKIKPYETGVCVYYIFICVYMYMCKYAVHIYIYYVCVNFFMLHMFKLHSLHPSHEAFFNLSVLGQLTLTKGPGIWPFFVRSAVFLGKARRQTVMDVQVKTCTINLSRNFHWNIAISSLQF